MSHCVLPSLTIKSGSMPQAVRRSPPTAGVPSSRLSHSMWVSWWTKRSLGFLMLQILFHHFSTLFSLILFHFIHPSDDASRVIGLFPCYSQTFKYRNFIASHLSTRPCVGRELRYHRVPWATTTPVVPWLSYSPLDLRFAGSNPAGDDGFFQSIKILSMTSFGREVKPWVPCRRFTAG